MNGMAGLIFVPTILFIIFVAPIWLVLHYRSKGRAVKGLNEEDRQEMEDLLRLADRLADRVDALERILDVEHPSWREEERRRTGSQRQDSAGDSQ